MTLELFGICQENHVIMHFLTPDTNNWSGPVNIWSGPAATGPTVWQPKKLMLNPVWYFTQSTVDQYGLDLLKMGPLLC